MLLMKVDFATAASQNEFKSYNLSLDKKTNIIQKITKNHEIFILFLSSREKRSIYDTFGEVCKQRFELQLWQNP